MPLRKQEVESGKKFVWVILLVSQIHFKKVVLLAKPPKKGPWSPIVPKELVTADINKARRFTSEKHAQAFIDKDSMGVSEIPLHYTPHIEHLELLPKKARKKKQVIQTKFGVVKLWPEQTHFLDDVEAL